MPKKFIVSMYNVGTVPLDEVSQIESSHKVERFDDESKAIESATAHKDKYQNVTVKNPDGEIILKYQNGRKI